MMSSNGQSAVERPVPELTNLPRRLYARVESLAQPAWTPWHRHPWGQLSYAIKGVLTVTTAEGSYVAPPQRAVWIAADVEHQVRSSPKAEMRSLYVGAEAAPYVGERCRVVAVSPLIRELIKTFSGFAREYDEAGPEGRLVSVMLDQLQAAPEVGLSLPAPQDGRLRLLCEALAANPSDERTLAQWSGVLGASEKTLSRAFLRDTELTFRTWRQRLRLISALERLEQGVAVTEVALDCGYNSPSAFIAAFRRQFGATPGAFALGV
ncbi:MULTISPECIES: AraC family transcriptional regulator [Pseudomonas]|nr:MULTISPECIES: helix-turn-helix transcriptional regulator [Pseudomonas]WCE09304.1 helix-turn-helix transcriptional regulator [Pseudomonas sp. JBR1]HAC67293.1 AraC family transcriptional regulator [Pseudomonas sp.]